MWFHKPSTWELDAERSVVEDQSWLHSTCEAADLATSIKNHLKFKSLLLKTHALQTQVQEAYEQKDLTWCFLPKE